MRWLKQKWYNLDGNTKTFKDLCSKMGMDAEYTFIYSILSTETHGKDGMENLDIQKFFVSVKKTNNKDAELHIATATLYLIETVRLIYSHYAMRKELKHFNGMVKVHHKFQ